jgi:hypothetical protein
MKKSHLLWMLVAVQVLLTFASAGAEGFFGWTLPPVLADYSHSEFVASPFANPASVFRLILLWGTTCIAFAAWFSLVVFWRGARRLYIVSNALGVLLILFSGARVDTSVSAMFREMSAVVGGVIFGLIYFSDLSRRFERVPGERGVPVGMGVSTQRA